MTVGMIRVVKAYANFSKLLVTEEFTVAYEAFKGLRPGLAAVAGEFSTILTEAPSNHTEDRL